MTYYLVYVRETEKYRYYCTLNVDSDEEMYTIVTNRYQSVMFLTQLFLEQDGDIQHVSEYTKEAYFDVSWAPMCDER